MSKTLTLSRKAITKKPRGAPRKLRARSSSLIMLVDERARAYIAFMAKKPTEPFITDLGPLVRGDPPIVGIHDDAPGPFETRAFAQADGFRFPKLGSVATSQHRGK
jgi:hypothetical protein